MFLGHLIDLEYQTVLIIWGNVTWKCFPQRAFQSFSTFNFQRREVVLNGCKRCWTTGSVQCSQILAGAAPPLGPLRAPEQEQSFLQKPEVLHRVLLGNSNWPEFSLLTHTMVGASPSMMDHLPPFSKRQIFQWSEEVPCPGRTHEKGCLQACSGDALSHWRAVEMLLVQWWKWNWPLFCGLWIVIERFSPVLGGFLLLWRNCSSSFKNKLGLGLFQSWPGT